MAHSGDSPDPGSRSPRTPACREREKLKEKRDLKSLLAGKEVGSSWQPAKNNLQFVKNNKELAQRHPLCRTWPQGTYEGKIIGSANAKRDYLPVRGVTLFGMVRPPCSWIPRAPWRPKTSVFLPAGCTEPLCLHWAGVVTEVHVSGLQDISLWAGIRDLFEGLQLAA